ncbi:MAG: VOC family protein [Acidobacteriota bacterium]
MMRATRSQFAAVLYAKDLVRVAAFYAEVIGLAVIERRAGHVVLESPTFQLVIVAVPPRIGAGIEIADPPTRREENPIKLVFFVPSLAESRPQVSSLGGELNPLEREWSFQGARVCDGHDPEGNVFQLRQVIPDH